MASWKSAARFVATLAITACSWATLAATSDPSPAESRGGLKPPPTRSIDHPTGATESGSRGAVSGSMTTEPEIEKEQRGNTPPGKDRDGHGPAAGAIVDPSGATTGRKPF